MNLNQAKTLYQVTGKIDGPLIPVVAALPVERDAFEFPSVWFDQAVPKKPLLIYYSSELTTVDLYRLTKTAIDSNNTDIDLVVEFMMSVIKDTLTADWVSFKIVIGRAGNTISPLDLIDVQTKARIHTGDTGGGTASQSEIMSLFWSIVSMYRLISLASGATAAYRDKIEKALSNVFPAYPFRAVRDYGYTYAKIVGQWATRSNYAFLIGVLDMFFNHFPRHRYAPCRVSTIVSRYKGSVLLTGMTALAKSLGILPSDLLEYVTRKEVADDIRRVFTTKQEVDEADSYARYLVDLRLTSRSPYSASANPSLHVWIHVIGTVCGFERSVNANIVGAPNLYPIVTSGLIVGFYLRSGFNNYRQFADENEILALNAAIAAELEFNGEGFQENTPQLVCARVIEHETQLPEITKLLKVDLAHLRDARTGTVGKLVKDRLGIE